MQFEEMKQSLDYLAKNNIKGNELYVQNLGTPAYIYYTQIHPAKARWKALIGGSSIEWGVNLDSLTRTFPKQAVTLYGWDASDNKTIRQAAEKENYIIADSNIVKGSSAYIYRKQ